MSCSLHRIGLKWNNDTLKPNPALSNGRAATEMDKIVEIKERTMRDRMQLNPSQLAR